MASFLAVRAFGSYFYPFWSQATGWLGLPPVCSTMADQAAAGGPPPPCDTSSCGAAPNFVVNQTVDHPDVLPPPGTLQEPNPAYHSDENPSPHSESDISQLSGILGLPPRSAAESESPPYNRLELGTDSDAMRVHETIVAAILDKDNKIGPAARAVLMPLVCALYRHTAHFFACAVAEKSRSQTLRAALDARQHELSALQTRLAGVISQDRTAAAPLCDVRRQPQVPRTFAAALSGASVAHLQGDAAIAASDVISDTIGPPQSGDSCLNHQPHQMFLTSAAPSDHVGSEVAALLKENIDPEAEGIGAVTFRASRRGLTVTSRNLVDLDRLKSAISRIEATRTSVNVRIPKQRNPHIRLTGVDPDVRPEDLISALNRRNHTLDLDPSSCKVRLSFPQRNGQFVHILETDPPAFARLCAARRVTIGWTSVEVCEDLHVPLCTFCAQYGHALKNCKLKNDPSQACCTRCAGSHALAACQSSIKDPNVKCAPCAAAGRPSDHHAGHVSCSILRERSDKIRARTQYGP